MTAAHKSIAPARKMMPEAGEDEADFMDRCMTDMMDSGQAPTEADAESMCQVMWEDNAKAVRSPIRRAYAILNVKSLEPEARVIRGMATTPEPDRVGDIVEPLGVAFKNPLPLLLHHRTDKPVGKVFFQQATKDGISFEAHLPEIRERGALRDRVEEAWQSIKAGLLAGVSIGFRALEHAALPNGGLRFLKSEVLELSLVTVPANASATIHTIKSLDAETVPSDQRSRIVRLSSPAVAGALSTRTTPKEGTKMKTIAEQIKDLEAKFTSHSARMNAIMQKSADEGRSTDEAERDEFADLEAQCETIKGDLERFRALERMNAFAAKPVVGYAMPAEAHGSESRYPTVSVKRPPKLEPGIGLAQLARCKALALKTQTSIERVAEQLYGPESLIVGVLKAPVAAGGVTSGNWAEYLVGTQTNIFADFAEYLRPRTIIGKFGINGLPDLRHVPFNTALVSQTGAGDGYWVGEGAAKPLTAFDFARTTLAPLKAANIAVLTDQMIRYSNPKADVLIRDQLAAALTQRIDTDFISPANGGTPNLKPASITNGATSIAATGTTDIADIVLDVRSIESAFDDAENPLESGVWIMAAKQARALASMYTDLGVLQFPTMGVTGGIFMGFPVIVTNLSSDNVILVNASDIYFADEGEISVDISTETSLEMVDGGSSQSSLSGTGASLVSMFQTNSVAFRAERTLNWARRRSTSVAYLTGVGWGGELHS